MDFCEHGGKNYLVCVDYYSKLLEAVQVSNKDSDVVIKVCKCSGFGILQHVIADIMSFSSFKFQNLSNE